MSERPVLDPASGSRMFYFDKQDKRVVFGDARREEHVLCDGRSLSVSPDVELDRENQSLRVRLGEVAYDERTHRFADQLRDLIDRFYDGDDDFEARPESPEGHREGK